MEATAEELTLSESPTTQGKTRWRRICKRFVHLHLDSLSSLFWSSFILSLVLFHLYFGPLSSWCWSPGGLGAVKPEGDVSSNGRRDRETEQAAGQDRRQDGRRRRQHRQGQREDTETAEVDAQSNSRYHAHYLKDFRTCWLGLLRKTMVVKCLYVETIVPLKDLNAFKQKCFRYSIFLQTIFLMYNFIFIKSSIQQTFI